MTIEEIIHLIKQGETRILELKKTTGELQEAMHSACAMLNSDGGHLIFGITPRSLKLVGQQVTDNTRQEIANALGHFEPAIDIIPEYIDIPNSTENKLIILSFNSWKWGKEPYVYKGCPYYKPESTTKIMPKEMYEERLKASNPQKFQWDIKPAYETNISDLDQERIKGVIQLGIRGNRLPASAESDNIEKILNKLHLLTKDGKPTHAAAMLFAKSTIHYPQFLLRMCRFQGITKNVFIDPKEVYGNFFEILDAAIDYCFKHLLLKGEIKGLRREETLEIPIEALREALINALCHRDYEQIYASTSLAIYNDRIEIANPGNFPVELTPTTILLPHSSYPHNPLIAHVLYQTTYLDKWGTGVERIVQLCNNANIPTPFYTIANRSVILTIPRVTYRAEHVNEQQVGSKLAASWQQVGSKLAARNQQTIQQITQRILKYTSPCSAYQICQEFGFKDVYKFKRDYITPLIEAGLMSMTEPQKPTSPTQKYYITNDGLQYLTLFLSN